MLPPNAVVTPFKSTWVENLGDLAFHEDKAKQLDAAATFMSYFVPEDMVRSEVEKAVFLFNKLGILLLPRHIVSNELGHTLAWVEHTYQTSIDKPNPFWGHFCRTFFVLPQPKAWVQPIFTTPQLMKKVPQAVSVAFNKRIREVNSILKSVGCEAGRKALMGIVFPPLMSPDTNFRVRNSSHVDEVTVNCHLVIEPSDLFYEDDSYGDSRYSNRFDVGYHPNNLGDVVAKLVMDLLFKDLRTIIPTDPKVVSINWPIKDCTLRFAIGDKCQSVEQILREPTNRGHCYEMHYVTIRSVPPTETIIMMEQDALWYDRPSYPDADYYEFPDFCQILNDGFLSTHKHFGIGVQLLPPECDNPWPNHWFKRKERFAEVVACQEEK